MAEILLSAISSALRVIGNAASTEIALRCGVDDELQWLESELLYMRAWIIIAEEQGQGDRLARQWRHDMKRLSLEVARELESYKQPRTFKNYILHPFTSKNSQISNQIKSFKQRLHDLRERSELYGIQRIVPPSDDPSPVPTPDSSRDENDLIGLADIATELTDELVNGDSSRKVVSIYGMGGLGKTTLAKSLYHSDPVKESFAVRIWVHVSPRYRINDLVGMAISSLKKYMTNEDLQRLHLLGEGDHLRFLQDFLNTRHYLLVLDEVWDTNVWEFLNRAFPDNNDYSRVIITTRKKSVAVGVRGGGGRSVHKLRFLNLVESLNLIRREVNPVTEDMITLAESMVSKCGGLPLAITLLGEIMNVNYDLAKWRRLNDENIWESLKRHKRYSTELADLLTLSYDNLPRDERKPLFLNIGMFPFGQEIDVNKLINMWVTELHDNGMRDSWAEDFFNELIDCSLITEEGSFWEKPTTCNAIHDVLRHLIIEKAKDVSYFDIFPLRNYARDERGVVVHMPSIRHAIHGRAAEYIRSLESLRVKPNKKVRTLLFFNTLGGVKARSLADQCALFRDLEVLDLTGIDFSLAWISFSYMLRKIRNLRFLVLANTSINKLPARIKNHRCLQILETGTNSLCILPKGIHRLQQLRHLHGFFHKTLCLPIAHTLHSVRVLSNPLFDIVMETGRMQDLQELSLRCQPQDSLFFIQQLRNLSTLIISSCNSPPGEDPSYVDLPSLEGLSACRNLTNVWLDGPLMPLPASDTYPRSLQRLILSRSALKNDPMPELEMLPNLTSLELMNAYDGKKMVCSKNRFQQLVYLRLSEAGNLREWEVHEGAMPSLQGLTISECPQLIRPQRFEGFPNAGKTKSVYGVPRYTDYNPPQM
ncbi:disease resistance protein RPP13-like protein [Tanacetum coccineum]